MVHLMRSDANCLKKVKLEVDDSGDDELRILIKRPKLNFFHEWSCNDDPLSIPPTLYNPLDEPSPLGLRLKKSPSLLDLIQTRLSQEDNTKLATANKKDHKGAKGSVVIDGKLKASNFPASILKIGTWEYKSRNEGDLVAKCYFAKHKLVWEVLDGCLKNKIEIPWSDIMALKANYPDDGPGTLEVVLARRPLFFREINPQPRKHTLWQATSDFTGGQASIQRRHFLWCPQGFLGKHFEKLIQCDPRLNFLSQQPDVLDSPYFDSKTAIDDQLESTAPFDRIGKGQAGLFELHDVESASAVQSSSSKSEHNLVGKGFENVSQEITSAPCSVMEPHRIKQLRSREADSLSREADSLKFLNNLDQIKVPGLHPSMSMNDIVNHIGNCISEGNPAFASDNEQSKLILEEITQYLLNDSLVTAALDEQFLMSRVNSFCCLLQKDPATTQDTNVRTDNTGGSAKVVEKTNLDLELSCRSMVPKSGDDDASGSKQVSGSGMRRKESVGELLLNLPRIASLPQFLFPMADDSVNQVR